LVGHNALDRVTKVYTEPHKVLDHLNTHVLALLRKDVQTVASIPDDLVRDLALSVEGVGPAGGRDIGGQDGMDLGMAAVNWETMMLEYAGANNPLYVVRRGELQELKPNKFAICSFEPNTKNYDVQKFPLESGDTLFLATGRVCGPIRRTAWQEVHAPPLQRVVGGNGFVAGDGA
jgi:hypothetical protein